MVQVFKSSVSDCCRAVALRLLFYSQKNLNSGIGALKILHRNYIKDKNKKNIYIFLASVRECVVSRSRVGV